jgi:hypothetical protein
MEFKTFDYFEDGYIFWRIFGVDWIVQRGFVRAPQNFADEKLGQEAKYWYESKMVHVAVLFSLVVRIVDKIVNVKVRPQVFNVLKVENKSLMIKNSF